MDLCGLLRTAVPENQAEFSITQRDGVSLFDVKTSGALDNLLRDFAAKAAGRQLSAVVDVSKITLTRNQATYLAFQITDLMIINKRLIVAYVDKPKGPVYIALDGGGVYTSTPAAIESLTP